MLTHREMIFVPLWMGGGVGGQAVVHHGLWVPAPRRRPACMGLGTGWQPLLQPQTRDGRRPKARPSPKSTYQPTSADAHANRGHCRHCRHAGVGAGGRAGTRAVQWGGGGSAWRRWRWALWSATRDRGCWVGTRQDGHTRSKPPGHGRRANGLQAATEAPAGQRPPPLGFAAIFMACGRSLRQEASCTSMQHAYCSLNPETTTDRNEVDTWKNILLGSRAGRAFCSLVKVDSLQKVLCFRPLPSRLSFSFILKRAAKQDDSYCPTFEVRAVLAHNGTAEAFRHTASSSCDAAAFGVISGLENLFSASIQLLAVSGAFRLSGRCFGRKRDVEWAPSARP